MRGIYAERYRYPKEINIIAPKTYKSIVSSTAKFLKAKLHFNMARFLIVTLDKVVAIRDMYKNPNLFAFYNKFGFFYYFKVDNVKTFML